MWREVRWEATGQAFVVQTGDSIEQAKVFKAHAVPQGLCANLITALKLLANQQEEGDGPSQNIVKDLGEGSRKGLTDGLREFVRSIMSVPLRLDTWTRAEEVRMPKVPEGCPEVTVREDSVELTLRAEEVGTLKAYINVDHVAKERWGPSLADHDWHAFCQALYVKASKEKIGKTCMSLTKK